MSLTAQALQGFLEARTNTQPETNRVGSEQPLDDVKPQHDDADDADLVRATTLQMAGNTRVKILIEWGCDCYNIWDWTFV